MKPLPPPIKLSTGRELLYTRAHGVVRIIGMAGITPAEWREYKRALASRRSPQP